MSIYVVEDLGCARRDRFTDPDALLSCDNPTCSVPWVTRTAGLVAWTVASPLNSSSLFTDRLVVACCAACLTAAQATHGRRTRRWSAPLPVGEWLDALRASIDVDPASTPIGTFAGET